MSNMGNGKLTVVVCRDSQDDSYEISIDNMKAGEVLNSISQLALALADKTDENIENILGSVYLGCLTPKELDRLQSEAKDENRALNQFQEMINQGK